MTTPQDKTSAAMRRVTFPLPTGQIITRTLLRSDTPWVLTAEEAEYVGLPERRWPLVLVEQDHAAFQFYRPITDVPVPSEFDDVVRHIHIVMHGGEEFGVAVPPRVGSGTWDDVARSEVSGVVRRWKDLHDVSHLNTVRQSLVTTANGEVVTYHDWTEVGAAAVAFAEDRRR